MQGQDAAHQGEDGLVVTLSLLVLALVVCPAGGAEQETKAEGNMANLSLLLSAWETCSPLMDEPDLLDPGAGSARDGGGRDP